MPLTAVAADKDFVNKSARPVFKGEKYVPTIWIDPDGCEHWVMDDGWEGFMDIRLDRNGKPICHSGNTCAELASDQLFATNSATLSAGARERLIALFSNARAKGFIINGHTDSRAGEAYNLRLSQRRAAAVARVAHDIGAMVYGVSGYGESAPKASNATAAGQAENRRVEIVCVH